MNKKIVSFAMTSVMAFALAVSAAAEGSEPSIEVGGEVRNTTDYTLVIPTGDFTHLDLGNVGVTGELVHNYLGDVKVVRNEGDTASFDRTKRIIIVTSSDHGDRTGNGALYNEAADASLTYELSRGSSNENGDLITYPVFRFGMIFSADDINHGTPQPLYLAVVDPTDKVPNGIYTDTLTFRVVLEDA